MGVGRTNLRSIVGYDSKSGVASSALHCTALQAFRTPKNAFSGPDWHPCMSFGEKSIHEGWHRFKHCPSAQHRISNPDDASKAKSSFLKEAMRWVRRLAMRVPSDLSLVSINTGNQRLCFHTKGSDSDSKIESLFFLFYFFLLILNIYLFSIDSKSNQNQTA